MARWQHWQPLGVAGVEAVAAKVEATSKIEVEVEEIVGVEVSPTLVKLQTKITLGAGVRHTHATRVLDTLTTLPSRPV